MEPNTMKKSARFGLPAIFMVVAAVFTPSFMKPTFEPTNPTPDLTALLANSSIPPAERLQQAIAAVGQYLDADRCFLYVRDPARGRGRIALVWRRDESVPDPRTAWFDDTIDLPKRDPMFRAALNARPSDYVEDVETAGPEVLNREFEREMFGHRALIHAHVVEGPTMWAILQPAMFGRTRSWTAAERAYIEAALPRFLPVVQAYMAEQSVG
jgi:GAF domain-containing protein